MDTEKKQNVVLDGSIISLETINRVIPRSSVYALKHRFKKKIQVFGSGSTLVHLGHLLEDIEANGEYLELKNDLENVDIVFLETNLDKKSIKKKISDWIVKFKEEGYELYKEVALMTYKLDPVIEFVGAGATYNLYIRNSVFSQLIGKFGKKKDMEAFIKENYNKLPIISIITHPSVKE